MDESVTPLYPFGYGLSYALSYSDVSIAKTKLEPGEVVEVGVTLANTGARAGQEVAALCPRSGGEPLAGVSKVALEPGDHPAGPRGALGFHGDDGTYFVEAGEIQLFVGGSSLAPPAGSIEIVGDLHVLPGERKAAKRGSLN